jgi:hypothetical protein
MSDWKRSTREAAFEQFSEDHKGRKGLFGSAENVYQYAIVTPRWLVWAIREKKSPAVLSALLKDVVIQDYADTPFVKLVPDSGIQVTGKFTDVSENSSAFLGLEQNATGEKFKEIVIRAVQDAKK